eukprot:jgi/Tetstr1/447645/TSEL_035004.t1
MNGSCDRPRSWKPTLLEFNRNMRYRVKYNTVPRATAVDRFERSLVGDIQQWLVSRDAAWQHNTEHGHFKGRPLRDIMEMSEYTGTVFGSMGEVSKRVRHTVRGVACFAADLGRLRPALNHNPGATPAHTQAHTTAAGS